MDIAENLATIGTPMTQKTSLEMLLLEGLLEERIMTKVEHTKAEIERSPHVGVHLLELLLGQGLVLDGRASRTKRSDGGGFVSHAESCIE